MALRYNDPLNGTMPQYHGNIAKQAYRNDGAANTFNYTYDALNRLTKGEVSPTIMSEVVTYDVMGNIASMNRDNTGERVYSYINDGNQLGSVPVLGVANYAYDANGNATTDGRTGATLQYNFLNLPISATIGSTTVAYTYDATGRKLKKTSSTMGTTDYVGGTQYQDGSIDFIQTEGGRAVNMNGSYKYDYNLPTILEM